jgi:putative membrane protein
MKKIKILAGCLSILLYATACNSGNEKQAAEVKQAAVEPNKVMDVTTMDAKEFVQKAGADGIAEIDMGKLAVKNAKDKEVKSFAQTLIDEHTKVNNELKKIASKQGITMPTSAGEENATMLNNLKKKTGAEFDKAFVKHMVEGHKEMLELYEKASKELTDTELKEFAATNVKVLQNHYDKATALEAKLNATSSSKTNKNSKTNSGSMKSN